MRTHYVRSGNVSLAYGVQSEKGPPLIYTPGAFSHLVLDETWPPFARFYQRLASFSRLVRWDRRGTGLSDQSAEIVPLAEQLDDLDAIRRAAGIERATLVGYSHGGALATLYAAEHPERVERLVLVDALVCGAANPFDPTPAWAGLDALNELITTDFEAYTATLSRTAAPGLDDGSADQAATIIQASASPAGQLQLLRIVQGTDMREALSHVRAPTLVIHAQGDRVLPIEHGRYLAQHIEGARLLEIDSDFHLVMADPAAASITLAAIEEFVTGSVAHTAERVLASVLFTDIVGSSAHQRRLGDEAWRALRGRFEGNARRIVEQFGGRVVQFTGDGVMAAFPTASQALGAGKALGSDARDLGVAIRAGVHTGEAHEVEDQLFGACVTLAARVAEQAGANELLATETVRDLVDGSEFAFRDAGLFELKGLGERRLVATA
ncbi:MAG: adenylate/guanylate cyclase domain-containing protein [Myxococcota bacterium]